MEKILRVCGWTACVAFGMAVVCFILANWCAVPVARIGAVALAGAFLAGAIAFGVEECPAPVGLTVSGTLILESVCLSIIGALMNLAGIVEVSVYEAYRTSVMGTMTVGLALLGVYCLVWAIAAFYRNNESEIYAAICNIFGGLLLMAGGFLLGMNCWVIPKMEWLQIVAGFAVIACVAMMLLLLAIGFMSGRIRRWI